MTAHVMTVDATVNPATELQGSVDEAEEEKESESFDVGNASTFELCMLKGIEVLHIVAAPVLPLYLSDLRSRWLQMWFGYWRDMFPAVTEDKIAEFEAQYRGSTEESADVLTAYLSAEGDMDEVLDNVMCSTHEDEERFVGIIRAALQAKKVPPFDAFTGPYSGGGRPNERTGAGAGAFQSVGVFMLRCLRLTRLAASCASKPLSCAVLYGDGSGGKAPSKRAASAAVRASKARSDRAAAEAAEADALMREMRESHVKKGGRQEDGLAAMIRARQAERARCACVCVCVLMVSEQPLFLCPPPHSRYASHLPPPASHPPSRPCSVR